MAKLHRGTKRAVKPIPTAYELLSVSPGDSIESIHERYKELALTNHPDKGGDGEKFAQITMAFSVLKNTREKYNKELRLLGRLNCPMCKGEGIVKVFRARKLRPARCSECDGTGEKK